MHPENPNEALILAPIRKPSMVDTLIWIVLGGLLALGFALWVRQYILGLGVTGLNRPIYWGVYITNFVFFIGLAHSGTFISAILRIAGQTWRKPLTRAAEAITIFSLPFAIWLMVSFFQDISMELEDSARLNGYNRLQVLRKVVLPLAAPVHASI